MIGKYVRAQGPGRPVQGLVVGESRKGTCWVLQKGNGMQEEWNKCYCEVIKAEETSKGVRKIKHPERIYGDGDC